MEAVPEYTNMLICEPARKIVVEVKKNQNCYNADLLMNQTVMRMQKQKAFLYWTTKILCLNETDLGHCSAIMTLLLKSYSKSSSGTLPIIPFGHSLVILILLGDLFLDWLRPILRVKGALAITGSNYE